MEIIVGKRYVVLSPIESKRSNYLPLVLEPGTVLYGWTGYRFRTESWVVIDVDSDYLTENYLRPLEG
jgi:hypothetical protein